MLSFFSVFAYAWPVIVGFLPGVLILRGQKSLRPSVTSSSSVNVNTRYRPSWNVSIESFSNSILLSMNSSAIVVYRY